MLLALEDYFRIPSIAVLADLYDSLNAIDTTGLPSLTLAERQILRTTDRKDLFEEKFPIPSGSGAGAGAGAGPARARADSRANLHGRSSSTQSAGGCSLAETSSNGHSADSSRRIPSTASSASANTRSAGSLAVRGVYSVESLASIADPTRHSPSVGTSASLSRDDLSLSGSPNLSRATTLNSIDDERGSHHHQQANRPPGGDGPSSKIPRSPSFTFSNQTSPTLLAREIGPTGRPKDTHLFETKVSYNGLSLPVKIPLSTFPTEIGDVRIPPYLNVEYSCTDGALDPQYSLIKLVQTFSGPGSLAPGPHHPHLHTAGAQTPAIIVLLNAILTGQRVVFLGHGQPAGRVAELVLAACALASGGGSVLHGIEDRAFPYTNLSNLDNLQNMYGIRVSLLCSEEHET